MPYASAQSLESEKHTVDLEAELPAPKDCKRPPRATEPEDCHCFRSARRNASTARAAWPAGLQPRMHNNEGSRGASKARAPCLRRR